MPDRKRPDAPRDPHRDIALKNWLTAIDKDLLMVALENQEFDSKYHRLAVSLTDPSKAHISLAMLTRMHDISMVDLVEKYREASMAVSHVAAQTILPEAVKQNAIDALPNMDMCPFCEGKGRVHKGDTGSNGRPKTRRCPKCLGTKQIRIPGQTDAKKLLFQSEGLIEAGGGQKVQVNVVSQVPSLSDTIDAQERAFRLAAEKDARASGAQVIDVPRETGKDGEQ